MRRENIVVINQTENKHENKNKHQQTKAGYKGRQKTNTTEKGNVEKKK